MRLIMVFVFEACVIRKRSILLAAYKLLLFHVKTQHFPHISIMSLNINHDICVCTHPGMLLIFIIFVVLSYSILLACIYGVFCQVLVLSSFPFLWNKIISLFLFLAICAIYPSIFFLDMCLFFYHFLYKVSRFCQVDAFLVFVSFWA